MAPCWLKDKLKLLSMIIKPFKSPCFTQDEQVIILKNVMTHASLPTPSSYLKWLSPPFPAQKRQNLVQCHLFL